MLAHVKIYHNVQYGSYINTSSCAGGNEQNKVDLAKSSQEN